MSKKLIAGAGVVASLAVALAPLATFATIGSSADSHTDELVVTVPVTCAFGNAANNIAGVGHTAVPDTTWSEAVGADAYTTDDVADDKLGFVTPGTADAHASENTAFRNIAAGTTNDAFAKTTLTVVCNNADGYTIKAVAGNLIGATDTNVNIPVAASYSTSASGYKATMAKTSGASTASELNSGAITSTTETSVAQNTGVSAEVGDVWDVTYGIGVASSQKAQVYHGKVVYTLYQGVAN